jgi:hypothetical protein
MQRILVHFSCGAASAVAWKVTEDRYGKDCDVRPIYCNMLKNEHPDNTRFIRDVEKWVGKKLEILSHPKYTDIDDLFLDTGFITSPHGAVCTKTMKRHVREKYQKWGDKHVFGLTADEESRISRFQHNNPDLGCLWVLALAGVTKNQCYHILSVAGIDLPEMYNLGYGHNNCIGCVKGGKGYWNKIRRDFPDVFAKRAIIQREVGCSFGGGENGFFLDTLDPDAGRDDPPQDIECGPFCLSVHSTSLDTAASRLPLTLIDTPPSPKRLR